MMTISSLTGVPDECQLLDTACIYDGQALNCIAYVQSCSVKFTKVGQTFATFLLKDKNANVKFRRHLQGNLFKYMARSRCLMGLIPSF